MMSKMFLIYHITDIMSLNFYCLIFIVVPQSLQIFFFLNSEDDFKLLRSKNHTITIWGSY